MNILKNIVITLSIIFASRGISAMTNPVNALLQHALIRSACTIKPSNKCRNNLYTQINPLYELFQTIHRQEDVKDLLSNKEDLAALNESLLKCFKLANTSLNEVETEQLIQTIQRKLNTFKQKIKYTELATRYQNAFDLCPVKQLSNNREIDLLNSEILSLFNQYSEQLSLKKQEKLISQIQVYVQDFADKIQQLNRKTKAFHPTIFDTDLYSSDSEDDQYLDSQTTEAIEKLALSSDDDEESSDRGVNTNEEDFEPFDGTFKTSNSHSKS
jgi:hypothetical protein